MLGNRPVPASAYCTSLINQTPGTVTVTSWAHSTTTPNPTTITKLVGTTVTTAYYTSTQTSQQTVLFKRAKSTPIEALIPLSCTSMPSAPVSYRASSACACLLSTSATVTITSTTISTLPALVCI
jgi:hypothetical protein